MREYKLMDWFCLTAIITSTVIVNGCSSDYVMMTRKGQMIKTRGRPVTDASGKHIVYTDRKGDIMQIPSDEISSMVEH